MAHVCLYKRALHIVIGLSRSGVSSTSLTSSQYINWPIIGNLVPPGDFSKEEQHARALNLSQWQIDNVPEKMQRLNVYMQV